MRSGLACSLMLLVISTATGALAQIAPAPSSAPATPTTAEPSAPAAPAAPPVAASATPTALPPAPPPPTGAYSCSLGDHNGVDPDSAVTVAQIVCSEVAARAPQPGSTYLVHLRRLGSAGVLVLEQRDAGGRTLGQRQVTLRALEEVPVAAPRLAESLLQGVPMQGTQRVNNLLEQETREQKRKWGATYWGIGVGGTAFPGAVGVIAPTFDLAVYHETETMAVGGDARLSTDSNGGNEKGASFEALSVGARYFTSDADVTPFLGGGLSWSGIQTNDGDWDRSGSGFSFYAEGGMEALRMYKTRLVLGLRATVPVYQVEQDYYYAPSYPGAPEQAPPDKKYVVPIALSATFMF